MRLITFRATGNSTAALDIAGHAVSLDACAVGWTETGLTNGRLLGIWPEKMADIARAAVFQSGEPAANLRLAPPIPDPQKIICTGLNDYDHAKKVGVTPPSTPIFFAKFANSLMGQKDDLIPPRNENRVDCEAELSVAIGKPGRSVRREDALAHLAVAMAFNGVSARDFHLANKLWTSGKAVDTFGPCDPALVTLDDPGDLQDLTIKTCVNDDTVQNGTAVSMIFGVADLIEFPTGVMTLEPGDIIAIGTPAGVARAHTPPRFLKPGDGVDVEIQGIGTLRNSVLEAEQ